MRYKWLLLPLVVLLLLPITASRSDAKGDINFMLGMKRVEDYGDLQESLDGNDDLGSQFDFGVEMTFSGAKWPIGIAVDLLGSTREETISYYYYYTGYYYDYDVTANTLEIDVGIRKIWEFPRNPVRPYLGGGIAMGRGEIEISAAGIPDVSDDDTGVGYWLGGGVFWRIGQSFNIGLNMRYSSAEVELLEELGNTEDVDVGGIHVGMLLGWGW